MNWIKKKICFDSLARRIHFEFVLIPRWIIVSSRISSYLIPREDFCRPVSKRNFTMLELSLSPNDWWKFNVYRAWKGRRYFLEENWKRIERKFSRELYTALVTTLVIRETIWIRNANDEFWSPFWKRPATYDNHRLNYVAIRSINIYHCSIQRALPSFIFYIAILIAPLSRSARFHRIFNRRHDR